MRHSASLRNAMICRCTIYGSEKTAGKLIKRYNWPFLIYHY